MNSGDIRKITIEKAELTCYSRPVLPKPPAAREVELRS